MIDKIKSFENKDLYEASVDFFKGLGLNINQISSTPIDTKDIFNEPIKAFENIKSIKKK